MTVPEPDLGPVPQPDADLRPPEQFIPAAAWSDIPDDIDFEPVPEPVEEPINELTDDERLAFQRLVTVGQRSKVIDVFGHTVVVQNLCVSDELRIGLYGRPYEGTKMENRAFQLGVCAAGIRTVDGSPLYQALTPETDEAAFDKKVEILEKYYPIVITRIYREILELDKEFAELSMKLGKIKG